MTYQNQNVFSQESKFHEKVTFYKDVFFGETVYANKFQSNNEDPVVFNGDVTIKGDLTVEGLGDFNYLLVRRRLDVGVGGTVFNADAETSKVGIGTTAPRQELDVIGTVIVSERVGIGSNQPEQRLDVAGSVKIDDDIYDSVNQPANPGGYFLSKDAGGIRWLPLIAEPRYDFLAAIGYTGINTADGIFVLDEMVPLYPS